VCVCVYPLYIHIHIPIPITVLAVCGGAAAEAANTPAQRRLQKSPASHDQVLRLQYKRLYREYESHTIIIIYTVPEASSRERKPSSGTHSQKYSLLVTFIYLI